MTLVQITLLAAVVLTGVTHTQQYALPVCNTQIAKTRFDEIFDLTAESSVSQIFTTYILLDPLLTPCDGTCDRIYHAPLKGWLSPKCL